jgi:hypothetical protein
MIATWYAFLLGAHSSDLTFFMILLTRHCLAFVCLPAKSSQSDMAFFKVNHIFNWMGSKFLVKKNKIKKMMLDV